MLILCGGLGYYIFTFMVAFCSNTKRNNEMKIVKKDSSIESQDSNPLPIKLNNLFMSIPTDEDLRRAYFWESKRIEGKEQQESVDKKRTARLKKLWRPKWYGQLEIKESILSLNTSKLRHWDQIYAVFQGHRLIWWKTSKHFDDGDLPLGQIIFTGHSGLAGLSPIEQRELQENELPLVLGIFGKGLKGQQKVTFLCPNDTVKQQLEIAVLDICNDAKND
uniref:PH domain-containing protein n=1 Tax=Eucampia antarctica TaxID=49252 RepID=A0A7S2R6A6_9STRA|mmetsp:Transcript_17733/g.17143  ORF Transcript_17733/g.17143 Transcript_17733/m.17143 type:complete len:220 (+) Transcript_17733:100-759(+)